MTTATRTTLLASLLILQSIAALAGEALPVPICGDVNDSSSVNTSDALLVLKRGVGQDVTLDCSAYDGQFSACQASLSAAASEVASCVADLGSTNADLLACSTGAKCGDGVVNSVGEHCDDEDLGGADCIALGHGEGTLGCDENCKFDTIGCSVCPEGSTEFLGSCWLLADVPNSEGVGSCDTACASIERTCDELALQAVGSSGSDSDCRLAADAADPADAPHAISPLPVESRHLCGPATDYSVGCLLAEGLGAEADGSIRVLYTGSATLCAADYYGGPCGTPARRVCACEP